MNRNTLLCALPLLASGIGLPVIAADIDTDDIQQKVDTGLDQTPASKPWKVRAGLLIETENKEGQSFDKDGFFEPTLWMDFSRDRWTFYGSYYQETHGTNYSDGFSRDNWFNQYEFDARYLMVDQKDLALGMTFHFRNYTFIYQDNPEKTQSGGYNSQRWSFQPDWRINFTDKFKSTGWVTVYNWYNNLHENGLANRELKGEGGFEYRFNPTIAVRLNYFIDRGWNTNSDDQTGEFCRSQLRPYIPITFSLFDAGPTTITPYGRWTLDVWSQNKSRNQRMHTTETRTGIFIEQKLSPHLSMTLDYAYEVQARHDLSPGDKPVVKFHKTGLGFIYSF
ncbi:OmpG family monomeric porin [Salmonella enterica]|uniref:OmpG family monomeric porin n=1 Tax=Enterobacter hormaechei TaxID=158836 RepID=UPI000DFDE969|nr:outer membrane lipoprotein G [Salmonella enterica subsp. arizonae]